MRTSDIFVTIRMAVATAMLTGLLSACGKPAPTPETAPPSPTGDAPAPTLPAPDETPPPDEAPAGPAQPSPDAPPPTDPAPAPKPTSSDEPALESMQKAQSNAKLGVPVDLRYRLDGDALAGQPAVLHLAAVPRVAGANLEVSIKPVSGLDVSAGSLNVQKTSAATVYRTQYSITRQAVGPAEIRVLVTMGVGEGSAFSWFSVPLAGGNSSQKQDSVKQR